MKKDRLAQCDEYQRIINQARPLDQKRVRNLKEYFKIGLTYSSNAIEGNTLTESETKVIIEDGFTIGGKPLADHMDAIGHGRAFDFLWKLAKTSEIVEQDILELHKICFQPKEGDRAGAYRTVNVLISGSSHNDRIPRFQDVPAKMAQFVGHLPVLKEERHPVEYAAALHLGFVKIHPFEDGNGRVARLLMNYALLQAGFPPVIIAPAFKHEYIYALEHSWTNRQSFTDYIVEQELQAQREYIRMLKLTDPASSPYSTEAT